MRRALRPAIVLTYLALLIGSGGCGGDDESTVSVPPISIPSGEVTTPSTPAATTTTAPPATTTGGARAKPNPAQPDSPANDVPPAPGSPEEAFEKQCAENPKACG